jgi:hypothetical protein
VIHLSFLLLQSAIVWIEFELVWYASIDQQRRTWPHRKINGATAKVYGLGLQVPETSPVGDRGVEVWPFGLHGLEISTQLGRQE